MSIEFDTTNYFETGHDTTLDGCGSMSWSWWMYPDNIGSEAIMGVSFSVFTKWSWVLAFYIGYFYLFITTDGTTVKQNRILDDYFNTTSWQHVVVTFDKTDAQNVHFFVNGSEIGLDLQQDLDADLYVSDQPLRIGCREDTHDFEFDGKLDEIAIWKNQVLTLAEIKLLYQSRKKRMPLQIHPETLSAYYPCDDRNIGQAFVGADCLKDISNVGTVEDCDATNNPTGAEGILSYPSRIKHI